MTTLDATLPTYLPTLTNGGILLLLILVATLLALATMRHRPVWACSTCHEQFDDFALLVDHEAYHHQLAEHRSHR